MVVIVDYGVVNLKNIFRGIESVGGNPTISSSPSEIAKADKLIVPGVGAFGSGIQELKSSGLDDAVKDFAGSQKPLLGICLGMQIFLTTGSEYGHHAGLNLVSGTVESIPSAKVGSKRKIPHIGWSAIECPTHLPNWNNTCLEKTDIGSFVYFNHSFVAFPACQSHILALCKYDGVVLTAAIKKDNVTGLQFHPERSGLVGLKILQQFISG